MKLTVSPATLADLRHNFIETPEGEFGVSYCGHITKDIEVHQGNKLKGNEAQIEI